MRFEIAYNTNEQLWKMESIAEKHDFSKKEDCYWVQIFENENGDCIICTREDEQLTFDPIEKMTRFFEEKQPTMKINNEKIVARWDDVMYDIGLEHHTINTELSELEGNKRYYGIEFGISKRRMLWMAKEALSWYYEEGNVRCDDRFLGEDEYKMWKSETGKLKRLIAALEKLDACELVAEWIPAE